jgi:hypothetical protein
MYSSHIGISQKSFHCSNCYNTTTQLVLSTVKNVLCKITITIGDYCNELAIESGLFSNPRTGINRRTNQSSSHKIRDNNNYKTKMYFYNEADFKKKDPYQYGDYDNLRNFNDQLYSELIQSAPRKKTFTNRSKTIVKKYIIYNLEQLIKTIQDHTSSSQMTITILLGDIRKLPSI